MKKIRAFLVTFTTWSTSWYFIRMAEWY